MFVKETKDVAQFVGYISDTAETGERETGNVEVDSVQSVLIVANSRGALDTSVPGGERERERERERESVIV